MLLELYIMYQLLVIVLFFVSYYTRNEIIWLMTLVFSSMIMMTSFGVEVPVYEYNVTTSAYDLVSHTYRYGYLFYLNMMFAFLALIFGFYDLWQKYVANSDAVKGQNGKILP